MEKRIIDPGDLKSRIENTFREFNWVNKYQINSKNDPFWVKIYVDPALVPFHEIKNFLEFLGDDVDKATCTVISNNTIVPLGDGYETGEEFIYLLGMNEIKTLLTKSFELPSSKYINAILKINEDIQLIIKDKKPLKV